MDGQGIIFIGGCMRTGTTLLHRMICTSEDSHAFTDECQYLTALLNFQTDWRQRFSWLKDFFDTPERFDRHAKATVDGFLRSALETQSPAKCLVLKNPELTLHFPQLGEWYPMAKLIVMVRDPRDTIASILDVAGRHRQSGVDSDIANLGRDMAALARFYKSYYVSALQSPKSRDRVAVVKYEDLVDDPGRAFAALSAILGMSLDPSRISPDKFDRRERDANVAAFWTELRTAPPSSDSVGRFRTALTPAEIAAIEHHCADFNRGLRYW
ncbi:MAG: sulfotransferase family protein [Dongiaceae bacterium]